jgi:hypothetical protein
MTGIYNQMLVPCCNPLHQMVITEDDYTNFEACTLGTVTTEYNIIHYGLHQYSHTSTNWDNKNKLT